MRMVTVEKFRAALYASGNEFNTFSRVFGEQTRNIALKISQFHGKNCYLFDHENELTIFFLTVKHALKWLDALTRGKFSLF